MPLPYRRKKKNLFTCTGCLRAPSSGRRLSVEKVNAKELKILYALKKGIRAPWEDVLWAHFQELARRGPGDISCGALVTQLAIALPLESDEVKIWDDERMAPTALDQRIGVVTKEGFKQLKDIMDAMEPEGSAQREAAEAKRRRKEVHRAESSRGAEEAHEEAENLAQEAEQGYYGYGYEESLEARFDQLNFEFSQYRQTNEQHWEDYYRRQREDDLYKEQMTERCERVLKQNERILKQNEDSAQQISDLTALIRANFPQHGQGPF